MKTLIILLLLVTPVYADNGDTKLEEFFGGTPFGSNDTFGHAASSGGNVANYAATAQNVNVFSVGAGSIHHSTFYCTIPTSPEAGKDVVWRSSNLIVTSAGDETIEYIMLMQGQWTPDQLGGRTDNFPRTPPIDIETSRPDSEALGYRVFVDLGNAVIYLDRFDSGFMTQLDTALLQAEQNPPPFGLAVGTHLDVTVVMTDTGYISAHILSSADREVDTFVFAFDSTYKGAKIFAHNVQSGAIESRWSTDSWVITGGDFVPFGASVASAVLADTSNPSRSLLSPLRMLRRRGGI